MKTPEAVLVVGGEGGELTLWRRRSSPRTWEYSTEVDDQSQLLFLPEAEAPATSTRSRTRWIDDWNTALLSLDRYPWARLHPMKVHPEFLQLIRDAVEQRLVGPDTGPARARWAAVLSGAR